MSFSWDYLSNIKNAQNEEGYLFLEAVALKQMRKRCIVTGRQIDRHAGRRGTKLVGVS